MVTTVASWTLRGSPYERSGAADGGRWIRGVLMALYVLLLSDNVLFVLQASGPSAWWWIAVRWRPVGDSGWLRVQGGSGTRIAVLQTHHTMPITIGAPFVGACCEWPGAQLCIAVRRVPLCAPSSSRLLPSRSIWRLRAPFLGGTI